ncbi:MAG TPA: FeoA family protein [Negativicutes bacterium]|jgi:Fe2+ transport system protein FeoA
MSEFVPITVLQPGDKGRISSLLAIGERHLRKLTVFGILPGVEIEVLQISPAYVLRVEHTQIALDQEIAKYIIVSI